VRLLDGFTTKLPPSGNKNRVRFNKRLGIGVIQMDKSLWGLDINNKDHLVFGGCDVVDLAREYGTPLFLIDENRVRTNYHRFLNAFNKHYTETQVFYSYKTNCIPAILKTLHEEGCGAEVVSPYEFWLAHQLGIESSRIIYNGVNKLKEDLMTAIQKGVGLINVDSLNEIKLLKMVSSKIRRHVNVGVRICPGSGWKAQFGIQNNRDNIIAIFKEMAESDFLDPCCLHVHFITGIRNTSLHSAVIKEIVALMNKLKEKLDLELKYLDLGGGFGVPAVKTLSLPEMALYKIFGITPKEPDISECPSIEGFGESITRCLINNLERYRLKRPILIFEPGRAITSDAQILLVTVGEIKKRKSGASFAITDGGMQNIAFPLSFEYHRCFLANRCSARIKDRYHVTGPLCSPEDLLYRNRRLPELKAGDILAIMDAGAYFTSFSNNFSFARPAVVLVKDGSHKIIRERENYEYMTALDRI